MGLREHEVARDRVQQQLTRTLALLALVACGGDVEAYSYCHIPCGNGLVQDAEACDDGDNDNGDGCSATCTQETGYLCNGSPLSTCRSCAATTLCTSSTCHIGTMGDSITRAVGELPGVTHWPELLGTALGGTYTITNTGISGQIIDLGKSEQWTNILSTAELDVLFIFMGRNDIELLDTPAIDVLADVAEVANSAMAQGVRVVTISALPWSGHSNWTAGKQAIQDTFNAGLASAATACRSHVDVYDAFEDVPGGDRLKAAYRFDEIHPNTVGQQALADVIEPLVGP